MATRLRPLTNDRPKCLLPIDGHCLLERAINALLQAGIDRITLVTGYLGKKIEAFIGQNFPDLDIHYIHNPLYETTNNIYSLYLMRADAEGEDVVLLDSDILFDPAILTRLLNDPAPDTLAINSHALGEEEIKVVLDDERRVSEISKTCSISKAVGESIGIEKMSAAYTAALFPEMEQMIEHEHLAGVFYERAFERLIPKGHRFCVTDVSDLFAVELDTVEDFEGAQTDFKKHQ
jgi:choline kinase